jgi:hypothetical protein
MAADAGLTLAELAKKTPLPSVDPPKAVRCEHLGSLVKPQSCGCWATATYKCEAKDGLEIIPLVNCPCDLYEEYKP